MGIGAAPASFQSPRDWTIEQRLDFYSIPEALTGCILCWAGTQSDGFPNIGVRGKARLAHRLAWEIAHGPIPEGMEVLHRCAVKACINVDHLFLGDDTEYGANKVRRGLQARGERISHKRRGGMQKETVLLIFRSKGTHQAVADRFGTSYSTAQNIRTGRSWSHVTGLPRIPQRRSRKRPSCDSATPQHSR